jgi:hypothetical protein
MAGARLSRRLNQLYHHEKLDVIRSHLPGWNFITVHYAYFVVSSLVGSLIVWGSSHPEKSIKYVDSLFLVVSALTEAGLNTVNLSELNTFQQVWLWLCIMMGSAIFVSIATVNTRKRVFEKEFRHIVQKQRELRRIHRRTLSSNAHIRSGSGGSIGGQSDAGARPLRSIAETLRRRMPGDHGSNEKDEAMEESAARQKNDPVMSLNGEDNEASEREDGRSRRNHGDDHVSFVTDRPMTQRSTGQELPRAFSFTGVVPHSNSTAFSGPNVNSLRRRLPEAVRDIGNELLEPVGLHYPNYLTKDNISRNGRFYNLSREERDHLGGVEYRAISLLAWFVPVYFVAWQLLGALGLGAYMAHNRAATARGNGIDPW